MKTKDKTQRQLNGKKKRNDLQHTTVLQMGDQNSG